MYEKLADCPSSKYTDKGSNSFRGQSYLDIYDKYFKDRKYDLLNFLEIGVSLHHEPDSTGSSLWMWEEYFPNASIYGIDIDPICKRYETERSKVFIGSQADDIFVQKVAQEARGFDIILDDGSHVNRYTLASFNSLIRHLRTGGLYIIEDLGCSYGSLGKDGAWNWPGMKYNDMSIDINNNREDMNKFFTDLLMRLDCSDGHFRSISFYHQLCIMQK